MTGSRHLAIAMGLLLAPVTVVPQESRQVEIAFVGQFSVAHIPSSQGDWLALVPAAGGMKLVHTNVGISEVPAACGDKRAKIVAPEADGAILLVLGAATLQPGPVTSYFEGQRFIHPAEEVGFRLATGVGAGFRAYGAAAPGEAETIVTNYELRMFRGGLTQTLATFRQLDWDAPPRLLWAGDLDRDGNLDALLDLQTHYAGNNFALFLSSGAEGGELVKQVARFETAGC